MTLSEKLDELERLGRHGKLVSEIPTPVLLALIDAVRALDWYADGLYPGDESETEVGVMRTGRRAREALAQLNERMGGG